MKHSIKKIFGNLSLFLFGISVFAGISFLITFDQQKSYNKLEILNNQKNIVLDLLNLQNNNVELMFIELNGKSKQIHIEIQRLHTLYSYNFIEKYLLSNSKEYISDLEALNSLATSFNEEVLDYYEKLSKNKSITKDELEKRASLFISKVDSTILKAVTYNQRKFDIHKHISLAAFIFILAGYLWYRKRLIAVYKDLEYLVHTNNQKYTIFSEEASSISARINRKNIVTKDQTMIDPVTEINNLKGMISSYKEKKGMKEDYFTSLSIIEIDNFSIENKIYSQELTQTILKKVAYIISLHEQVSDVIARTDYNQFTVILCRAKREDSFKEIDSIRQSVLELKIDSAELRDAKITISGGHIIKPNNISLDEAVIQAKKVLLHAQKNGKNRISQVKDLAESEL